MNETRSRAAPIVADNVGRALILTVISILVFGVQDAISKTLVQTYSPFQIIMLRYFAMAAFSLILVSRQAPLREALRSRAPLTQGLRGVLLMGDIWLFGFALIVVPLGELQAIMLIYPLLVTLFSIPILGEKVGRFRWAAVIVGFMGALVIVRPGGLPIGHGVAFVVGSAICFALYITLTRKVSRVDTTATSMAYVGLVGLVLSTGAGVFHWQGMDWHAMALVGILMITTCVGHGLMMLTLALAPASTLQPFNYLALPWGITLSFVVFGHLIDPISLVGAGVIVGAGLVVMARERRRHGGKSPPLPPRS